MTYVLSDADLERCRAINMRHRDRVKAIALAVSAETSIPISAIYGRSRVSEVVQARWMVMRLAAQEGLSTVAIGLALNRDHTTVIHALKMERQRMESETPTV